jgi:hypothetical protein
MHNILCVGVLNVVKVGKSYPKNMQDIPVFTLCTKKDVTFEVRALQRSKTLTWAHEDQNASCRTPFNYDIRKESVDNNDTIIRLCAESRRNKQFREQGEGVRSTDKMKVSCGQRV